MGMSHLRDIFHSRNFIQGPVDKSYSAFLQIVALHELMMNQSSDAYMRYQASVN